MSKASKNMTAAILAGLLSTGIAHGQPTTTAAADYVKCYGIAKKSKNDCGNKRHSCAGKARRNNQPDEWVYTNKAKCQQKGGSINKAKT
jgi:uncharacterized membrane protein